MKEDCVFCRIVCRQEPCHRVWEDERHVAFLSIFPNTRGTTVVVPKKHYPSYAFDLPKRAFLELVLAARAVGRLLDRKFKDVGRTALVFEGFGVDHMHAKLFPLHGTVLKRWKPLHSARSKVFERYEGYVSTHDARRADDKDLAALAKFLRG